MPLPTLEVGPWHHSSNIATGGTSMLADAAETMFEIFAALIGGTGCPNPWIVRGTSDGSLAGMDGPGTNRWTDPSKLVWHTTGSHSWAVIEDANGAQLLMECRSNSSSYYGRNAKFVWSPNGGFAGTATPIVPPYAPNGIVLADYTTPWLAALYNLAGIYKTHVMQSNDGKHTRVFWCYNNFVPGRMIFSEAFDPVAGWGLPVIGNINTSATTSETYGPTYGQLHNGPYTRARVSSGGQAMTMYMTTEGAVSDAVGEYMSVPNEIIGEHSLTGIGLLSSNIGSRGRHGRIPDIWFSTDELPNGTTFPTGGSRQFCKFGDVVVPWDGSVPQIG